MPKYCEICDVHIPSLKKHYETAKHMKKETDIKALEEYTEKIDNILNTLDMGLVDRMLQRHYVVRRYYDDETKMFKEEIVNLKN